ncbi:hypothetical protein TWF192_003652 [Orbilia oligospora]|uniref:Calcofluor white hypersensitive protein n=1 Tax=Orbilia oligospora TaxID=2813651 RepID=A0A6G1LS68_ORBOL|nr:hypothetical protein TWF679_004020 [Orbilia oligospora]KAF3230283.1 hypothetical protein TWF191_010978 [Orbilia oligospora]KAF3231391.1 hypothetical protein TWF192_003652 [Orbilia oligospora]
MKDKEGSTLVSLNGKWISHTHTVLAYLGFIGALLVGLNLHFYKIVKNEHYGYPQEWFPSVSATIGDRYPERSVFQICIALTSGPRFLLVVLWYYLTARPGASLPKFVAFTGVARTFLCGGWVYITSTDDHDWHDIFMISYLVLTLPWTLGCLATSPVNAKAIKYRKILATLFFGTLVPLIYFFIQHKVHKVAGAYTIYAFFEWSLILYDVGFDAVTALDFEGFELRLVDTKGFHKGTTQLADVYADDAKKTKQPLAQEFTGTFSWAALIDTASDVYLGFAFWSILTALGVVVWYFPLWHMGISGYEIAILATISPYLLVNRSVRKFVFLNLHIIYSASLLTLVAFFFVTPEIRLFLTTTGLFFACLAWAANFSLESTTSRIDIKTSAFSLGLIMSSVAKFSNHTNNPIWPLMNSVNGGWNKIGLVLAVLAIARTHFRRPTAPAVDTTMYSGKDGSQYLASIGFGGLLFGLHSLLSDSSTMITWVWDGYPVKGPLAVPHGAYTIIAMGAGFLIGILRQEFATSPAFYVIGCIGAAFLQSFHGWWGYYGALTLAVYLMAITPSFIQMCARYPPGATFGTGFMVYNLLVLAHVWVVAYAFVPGGFLLRERTWLVMTIMMALIGVGLSVIIGTKAGGPTSKSQNNYSSIRKPSRSYFVYSLAFLELLAVSIAYLRFPHLDYKPYHEKEKLVTAGIWTVHFALDNDMWSSERRMRDLIKEMELDVVGLLESDLQRIIMGNRDMTQFLAEDLGMYADFGPGPNKHTWGAALLSKFPIVNSTHHLLPSPVGELAPAILATLDMYGTMVDVLVFHSGQEEDVEDRRLQSEGISKLMGDSPRPLILLSYLVTKPKKGNYNTYVSKESRMRDIDSTDWDRWCEYILYRDLHRVGYARVSRSSITDTELQVGKFVIDGKQSSEIRVDEEDVPEGWRFPAQFNGDGVRGHHYHVFDEPRYFR